MPENLLEAPERNAIEALLSKCNAGLGKAAPTFEQLLGFVSAAAITPGGFGLSDWLQPLFDFNGVVLSDFEDIERMTASVTSLYDRAEAVYLRGESILPFNMDDVQVVVTPQPLIDWATGLHGAVALQEDIWYPYEDDAEWVPEKLKQEVNLNIQCLSTLVDPASIPEVVKDPIPFQQNILKDLPGWEPEEKPRETWDDELMGLFRCFSMARLSVIVDSLQRYSTAYDNVTVEELRRLGLIRDDPVAGEVAGKCDEAKKAPPGSE